MELDAQLDTRLGLLQSSGQVDADIVELMRRAAPELAQSTGQPLTDAVFGGLVTHAAMALQRTRAGEAVTAWETDHADELAAFPGALRAAEAFAERAEAELSVEVPAQERQFMALHLAAIEQGAG